MSYRGLGALLLGTTVLSGCQATGVWGSLAVFAVSVGIFVRTLALGQGRHGR